ncbi:MAG TPA: stage II sporulation protein M, partial [Ramlibacter sp.]|nr:stage II sporulation protein M [Ramlibacter sp.]
HAAFELTAIVLAGAAGLRLGHAWVAPGHLPRGEALRAAAREAVVIVYGVVGMLVVAAGVEAFWSSARWVQPSVKFGVGGACWLLVIAYLGWSGRGAPAEGERHAG